MQACEASSNFVKPKKSQTQWICNDKDYIWGSLYITWKAWDILGIYSILYLETSSRGVAINFRQTCHGMFIGSANTKKVLPTSDSIFHTYLVKALKIYSRVHISSDEVFSKILKKPSIVQKKNDTSYESLWSL